jgi:selenocysteine lyase/cysteine desulfurase
MKEGLAKMPHVELRTAVDEGLSAGMVCFDVQGMKPEEVVKRLLDRKIIASTTPYRVSYARVACGITNTSEQVERTLAAVRQLA